MAYFAFLLKMLSYFRNCKHCGLGFFQNHFRSIDLFCQKCWLKLYEERSPSRVVIYKSSEIKVRSLFLWKEKESIVGDLIHALKGGTPKDVLQRLSIEMCMKFFTQKDCIVIPVPSSKVGEKDHAFYMAKTISETLDLELWDGLIWQNKIGNQKFLKKTERFVSQMEKTERINCKKHIILIDDLVTTGATALAAHKAIKGLNQIEVWALACRI